jgi:hypothetical protein
MTNQCKECGEYFDSDKGLHSHLNKKHGLFQAEYYVKHYPKLSLLFRRQIPYKNKTDYFSREFISYEEMNQWLERAKPEDAKKKIIQLIKHRIEEKDYSYSPPHLELKTLELPSILIIKKLFGSYKAFCDLLNIEPLFSQPLIKDFNKINDFEVIIDSREQNPLVFKKSKVEKLFVGDYLLKNGYSYTFVDRKSKEDFLGTLSQFGIDRFKLEVQKSIALDGYLFVVVESTPSEIESHCKRFGKMINFGYSIHNMRAMTHEFARKIQFIFTGTREKSQQLIPKLLFHGPKLWQTDMQYYLDYGLD